MTKSVNCCTFPAKSGQSITYQNKGNLRGISCNFLTISFVETRDEDPTFFSLDPDKLKKNPDPTLIRNEDLINHNFRIEFDDSGLYFIFFTLR